MTFSSQHEYWCRLPTHLWGVSRLTERLISILQDNIRRSLPKVITEISSRMAETQKSLSSLGTPLETPGSQSQQFGKWADQYLRLMEAAMNGRYELLPTSSSKSSTKDEVTGNINARLRAVLRSYHGNKDHVTGVGRKKTQEEVAVGDAVQGEIDGVWRKTNGTDICCEEFDQWKSKQHCASMNGLYLNSSFAKTEVMSLRFSRRTKFFAICFVSAGQVGPPTEKLLSAYQSPTKMVSDFVSKEVHASSRVVAFLVSTAADVLDRVVEAASQEMKIPLLAVHSRRTFRLQALQEQMKAAVPVDLDGKVLLTEVMKAVESVTLSTEDRENLRCRWHCKPAWMWRFLGLWMLSNATE
ncbi:Dynamin superfamily [Phytophthora cactorum]|nr:Dynamin superfamily [Phytophthora cactorum]